MTSTIRRLTVVLAYLLSAVACGKKETPAAPAPVVPVRVGITSTATVPVNLRVIGTVTAISSVDIKPQVTGTIAAVCFREGQDVKEGEVLFRIDARPFEVELKKARAMLARNKATTDFLARQIVRFTELYEKGVATREQLERAKSEADLASAQTQADYAAIAAAQLNLSYCTVKAPADARTGAAKVHVGSVVKANDVPVLVTLNQIAPIHISFAVPEQYLTEIKSRMAEKRLMVTATVCDDGTAVETGEVCFLDNTVDARTGTITLKAIFPNTDRRLWPGQFVDISLTLSEKVNTVVAPAAAVMTGQDGQYVFVVKSDRTVERRPVVASVMYDGMIVVDQGLKPAETVVTDGQLRLTAGSRISVVTDAGADTAPPVIREAPVDNAPAPAGSALRP